MNANVGMQHPVMAPITAYTPGEDITYGTGMVVAEAIAASVTWNRESGSFRGDDRELDSTNGVLGYSIDFESSGVTDTIRKTMLGEVKNSNEYEITDAAAPDIGFGYVRVMRTTNESTGVVSESYEGWWFRKCKFSLNSEETRTKGENTEWRTPTLNAVGAGVVTDSSKTIRYAVHETFDSLEDAYDYVDTYANITSVVTT